MFIFRLIFWPIRLLIKLVVFIIIVTLLVTLYFSYKAPSNDREWEENSSILPHFEISDDEIKIENIRNWRYKKGEVISKDYYNDTFDLKEIEKMYLVFNPFGGQAVAHSFLVFEFKDGKTVSVSVEARREEGETYDMYRGLLAKYEIWYVFGGVGDLLGSRIFYSEQDLRVYPIEADPALVREVFVDLAKTGKELETNPKFYNTLTSNCTNVLAEAANRVKKGSVPWNKARILTGYADNHLYDLGYIKNDKPFSEVYEKARVDKKLQEEFKDNPNFTNEEFWQKLSDRI